jgi:hypothetical protein
MKDMLLNPGWFKVEYTSPRGTKRATVYAQDQFDAIYETEQHARKQFNTVTDVIRVLEIRK